LHFKFDSEIFAKTAASMSSKIALDLKHVSKDGRSFKNKNDASSLSELSEIELQELREVAPLCNRADMQQSLTKPESSRVIGRCAASLEEHARLRRVHWFARFVRFAE
jgi:hypothetical protein